MKIGLIASSFLFFLTVSANADNPKCDVNYPRAIGHAWEQANKKPVDPEIAKWRAKAFPQKSTTINNSLSGLAFIGTKNGKTNATRWLQGLAENEIFKLSGQTLRCK